jgi:hypothetical protein
MKLWLIPLALFISGPASLIVSVIALRCGVPAGLAMAIGFGLCTPIAWHLLARRSQH